jgi:hypothetical protein
MGQPSSDGTASTDGSLGYRITTNNHRYSVSNCTYPQKYSTLAQPQIYCKISSSPINSDLKNTVDLRIQREKKIENV